MNMDFNNIDLNNRDNDSFNNSNENFGAEDFAEFLSNESSNTTDERNNWNNTSDDTMKDRAGGETHETVVLNANGGNGSQTFYQEKYNNKKKRKKEKQKRGATLRQLIAVALISSILGGGVVFTAFQFVAPAIQPSVGSYFGKFVGNNMETVSVSEGAKETIIKKIEIEQTDSPIVAIAEKVSPSIVGVRVNAVRYDFIFGTAKSTEEGSGIIISEDGYIITNNHVIESALKSNRGTEMAEGASIEVILPAKPDTPYQATVVGRDEKTDLAVIKIDEKSLPAAELGRSADLKVGELAVAIGNPGGLDYMGSVTAGIISGLNRTIETSDGKKLTLIQTDAAINPGNSGGALVNSKGEVIGINTIKVAATGYEGLGFAIPIDFAKEIAQNLIEYKYVKGRPFLGISADLRFTKEIADRNNVPMGVLVGDVMTLSAAQKAGIKAGDIITHFAGERIESFSQLEEVKNKYKPGDVVKVTVYRNGQSLELEVTLDEEK